MEETIGKAVYTHPNSQSRGSPSIEGSGGGCETTFDLGRSQSHEPQAVVVLYCIVLCGVGACALFFSFFIHCGFVPVGESVKRTGVGFTSSTMHESAGVRQEDGTSKRDVGQHGQDPKSTHTVHDRPEG